MITEFSHDIIARKRSAQEIAKEYLANAKKINKRTNAFIDFCDPLALESAKRIDAKARAKKPLGALAGVPIAIKDNILVEGYPATAASRMLANYTAAFDADVVRFLKEEGALIIGKTNMDEFAMGSSSETSYKGRVKHHLDESLVPGGSSGGSAVAVASGQVPVALGSDTGGSIRQPASFTGTIGLKPTYGRVSRSGLIAMASSLDQIGIFAQSIEDTASVLSVISDSTRYDATHARRDLPAFRISSQEAFTALKGAIIGVPKEYIGEGLDRNIKAGLDTLLGRLEKAGARIEYMSLPSLEASLACYYIIMSAEVSSNMARYDGIRYAAVEGTTKKVAKFEERYRHTRGIGLGQEVRRRVMLGTYVLSAGYIDKYYLQAQKVRRALVNEYNEAFRKVNILLGPTSPIFPFKAGEKLDDPLSMYLADIYTVAPNLAGVPAISLPLSGLSLPAGVQIIGSQFDEATLLTLSQGIMSLL